LTYHRRQSAAFGAALEVSEHFAASAAFRAEIKGTLEE